MHHGKIRQGEQRFEELHWQDDDMAELHNDKVLWVYMICAYDKLSVGPGLGDLTLHQLIQTGTLDWTGPNNHLHQSTQGLRRCCKMLLFYSSPQLFSRWGIGRGVNC